MQTRIFLHFPNFPGKENSGGEETHLYSSFSLLVSTGSILFLSPTDLTPTPPMYGGPAKLGRGGSAVGGRGGGKRGIHSSFPPPPPHRPSVPASRLSVGGAGGAGPRNRATNSGATTPAHLPASEETFSLVTRNPLAFAMIIRLAPDLVDEIKRVEAQGGTARIKFDSNANNPSGNVSFLGFLQLGVVRFIVLRFFFEVGWAIVLNL